MIVCSAARTAAEPASRASALSCSAPVASTAITALTGQSSGACTLAGASPGSAAHGASLPPQPPSTRIVAPSAARVIHRCVICALCVPWIA
jgi:hypothetical protein